MTRIYNFSAGPATLPLSILEQVQAELLDWQGLGMSILEVSHRGEAFQALMAQAIADLSELMAIPKNYKILFLPGGGQTQFSAVPMNLLGDNDSADYVMSGIWAKKAINAARKHAQVNVVASNESLEKPGLIPFSDWQCSPNASFLHITSNETIEGLEYDGVPDSDVPIVADMSSNILSKPMDVFKYGVIYAGLQKNIGPAGLALVIIREDLLDREAESTTPVTLNYRAQAEQNSCCNTIPVFQVYMASLMFAWLKAQGGLDRFAKLNARKAAYLYDAIDNSAFFTNHCDPTYRSRMNVVFNLPDPALELTFRQEAEQAGLSYLKGHRLLGGMRASLYNAMPLAGVEALVAFMADFERRYG